MIRKLLFLDKSNRQADSSPFTLPSVWPQTGCLELKDVSWPYGSKPMYYRWQSRKPSVTWLFIFALSGEVNPPWVVNPIFSSMRKVDPCLIHCWCEQMKELLIDRTKPPDMVVQLVIVYKVFSQLSLIWFLCQLYELGCKPIVRRRMWIRQGKGSAQSKETVSRERDLSGPPRLWPAWMVLAERPTLAAKWVSISGGTYTRSIVQQEPAYSHKT